MHGKGEYVWSENKRYVGGYKHNLRDGYGEFYWPDGKIFKGKWVKGL